MSYNRTNRGVYDNSCLKTTIVQSYKQGGCTILPTKPTTGRKQTLGASSCGSWLMLQVFLLYSSMIKKTSSGGKFCDITDFILWARGVHECAKKHAFVGEYHRFGGCSYLGAAATERRLCAFEGLIGEGVCEGKGVFVGVLNMAKPTKRRRDDAKSSDLCQDKH